MVTDSRSCIVRRSSFTLLPEATTAQSLFISRWSRFHALTTDLWIKTTISSLHCRTVQYSCSSIHTVLSFCCPQTSQSSSCSLGSSSQPQFPAGREASSGVAGGSSACSSRGAHQQPPPCPPGTASAQHFEASHTRLSGAARNSLAVGMCKAALRGCGGLQDARHFGTASQTTPRGRGSGDASSTSRMPAVPVPRMFPHPFELLENVTAQQEAGESVDGE